MAWLRNLGAEDSAAAAAGGAGQHLEPVQLELGRQDGIEVEIVCRRLESEGVRLRWYTQTLTSRALRTPLGKAPTIVLVHPDDADHVRGELTEAGLL